LPDVCTGLVLLKHQLCDQETKARPAMSKAMKGACR
jgi:hypothetical protein